MFRYFVLFSIPCQDSLCLSGKLPVRNVTSQSTFLNILSSSTVSLPLESSRLEVVNLVAVYFSSEKETALPKTGKGHPYIYVYTMLAYVLKVSRQIRCRCDTQPFFSLCTHRKIFFFWSVEFVCYGFLVAQLLLCKALGSILFSDERQFDSTMAGICASADTNALFSVAFLAEI